MTTILRYLAISGMVLLSFSACKKNDSPEPVSRSIPRAVVLVNDKKNRSQ